jgi:hypothetical protein
LSRRSLSGNTFVQRWLSTLISGRASEPMLLT